MDFDPKHRNVLILVDLMKEAGASRYITDLFTRRGHHRNISVIQITQNIYFKGREASNISLNAYYLVLFKNTQDPVQIHYLARQIRPRKPRIVVLDASELTTSMPKGYLFIDFRICILESHRLRTKVLSDKSGEQYVVPL